MFSSMSITPLPGQSAAVASDDGNMTAIQQGEERPYITGITGCILHTNGLVQKGHTAGWGEAIHHWDYWLYLTYQWLSAKRSYSRVGRGHTSLGLLAVSYIPMASVVQKGHTAGWGGAIHHWDYWLYHTYQWLGAKRSNCLFFRPQGPYQLFNTLSPGDVALILDV